MSELQRYHMIQACIDVIKKKKKKVNYFEIGVQTGFCFFKIKAERKVAIDPNFIIKITKKVKAYYRNLSNFNNRFFELTSDDFFEQKSDYIKKIGGIDVIFIDGLHLYEQVVKDIENSLKYLNKGGVILVHDCNPLSEPAAVRAYTSEEAAVLVGSHPQWINQWNGDVWKAIVKLRSERKDLNITVINSDHGVGIIRPGVPEKAFSFEEGDMDKLTYADLDNNRETYLNLKSPETFASFVKELEKEFK
ncbi:class I SAM-dependent methyltransferase [Mucilaginibacter dorajii]|nr:class I SAM-dependent methyltransferase [Mucilaginibacter dorajii]MCS3737886.1 putative O-methyltransferase YrrM [Mucilaginibacter dorajii]